MTAPLSAEDYASFARAHALTVEFPTTADFRNGAAGDVVVAQCSCDRYEFTTSPAEAKYWHWLHRATPSATPAYLLATLVNRPMPDGWSEPVQAETAVEQEPHVCVDCSGLGSTEMSGAADGRFYAIGSRRTCAICEGTGVLDAEKARRASAARIAAQFAERAVN